MEGGNTVEENQFNAAFWVSLLRTPARPITLQWPETVSPFLESLSPSHCLSLPPLNTGQLPTHQSHMVRALTAWKSQAWMQPTKGRAMGSNSVQLGHAPFHPFLGAHLSNPPWSVPASAGQRLGDSPGAFINCWGQPSLGDCPHTGVIPGLHYKAASSCLKSLFNSAFPLNIT